MEYFAIDIGSSFIKTARLLLDEARAVIWKKVPTPAFLPAEHPGQKALSLPCLSGQIRELLDAAYLIHPFDGVVFSSQMHGLQLFSSDGTPFGLCTTWQDETAAYPVGGVPASVEQLRCDPRFRKIGVELSTAHTASQLFAACMRGIKPPFYVSSLADGLLNLLVGSFLPVHPTIAHAFGLYDPDNGVWDKDLLSAYGFEDFVFPSVVRDEMQPVGSILLHGHEVPLFAPIGDQQAAVLGNLPGDHDLLLNIATGSQAISLENHPQPGPYERRPYFEGRLFRTVTHIPAGRMLNLIIDAFADTCQRLTGTTTDRSLLWTRATEAVSRLSGTTLRFDTAVYQTYGASSGGCVTGITPETLRFDHFLYAAYQDVAQNFSRCYEQMKEPGNVLHSVCLTGGVAQRSPFLVGMISEAFGTKAVLSPYADEVLTGLLRFALCASGKCRTPAETAALV